MDPTLQQVESASSFPQKEGGTATVCEDLTTVCIPCPSATKRKETEKTGNAVMLQNKGEVREDGF